MEEAFCPICQSELEMFRPYGDPPRRNAHCPICYSLERHRLVWKYIQDEGLPLTGRLLHFAPEQCLAEAFMKRNIEYFPCDLEPETYPDITVTAADITAIPFEDNYFDVVICNHVLEHIPDDRKAMSELYRVMKPGGWGIFQVPIQYNRATTYEDMSITTEEGRLEAFGQEDHVRIYGCDYKDRLAGAGFQVKEDDYVRSFTPEDLFRFGLRATEMVYFCVKPN